MTTLRRDPLAAVWGLLAAVTCLSWWLGAGHGTTAATAAALAIAFVKVRFIGQWFMELRIAPSTLRWAFDGWVGVVGCALVGLYLAG